ncbi:unnamed protein product [Phytophthora fragariaefolia]|uniref:Unnamed protein product n=1 Tax=Phytophthora fragariaefolia TaxID=1490495 RepID=A0A9W6TZ88_9STRA|nr:unnamed protein product [Phytophthora fragariaefolia]
MASPPTERCLKRPSRKQKVNVRLSDYVVAHVQATTDVQIPTTYKHTSASKFWSLWRAAMLAELQSLKKHKTWKLVPRTDAKKHKVRWVFAVKKAERGRIKIFKARLVIHGFKQELGINYIETYAPVIRFGTIRASQHGGQFFIAEAKSVPVMGLHSQHCRMSRHGVPPDNDKPRIQLLVVLGSEGALGGLLRPLEGTQPSADDGFETFDLCSLT